MEPSADNSCEEASRGMEATAGDCDQEASRAMEAMNNQQLPGVDLQHTARQTNRCVASRPSQNRGPPKSLEAPRKRQRKATAPCRAAHDAMWELSASSPIRKLPAIASAHPTAAITTTSPAKRRRGRPKKQYVLRAALEATPLKECSECGTSKTPMWRRLGGRIYCNACGLRHKPSQARLRGAR
ncbi:hypothetical protein WJX72_012530 [[Myrmecia] bisecta]|uniref:GATA-type domain-containing protein n=1 Tax=[Myrmecia] bisecta TaxID=41462 RepID=A0AAW1PCB4_9CHLO